MAFDGWSISQNLFKYLCCNLSAGKTILELGSGPGTEELLKFWKVYSIEHDPSWIDKYNSIYIYAPLKQHKPIKKFDESENLWYDRDVLKKELPAIKYDLILIDGPPAPNRCGIVKYFDLFNWNVPIILDDIHRTYEKEIIHRLSQKVKRSYRIYDAWEQKSFGVIDEANPQL